MQLAVTHGSLSMLESRGLKGVLCLHRTSTQLTILSRRSGLSAIAFYRTEVNQAVQPCNNQLYIIHAIPTIPSAGV